MASGFRKISTTRSQGSLEKERPERRAKILIGGGPSSKRLHSIPLLSFFAQDRTPSRWAFGPCYRGGGLSRFFRGEKTSRSTRVLPQRTQVRRFLGKKKCLFTSIPLLSFFCPGQDSNLHYLSAPEPKSGVSTNFTTWA